MHTYLSRSAPICFHLTLSCALLPDILPFTCGSVMDAVLALNYSIESAAIDGDDTAIRLNRQNGRFTF